MNWQDYQTEFDFDGSWRDIYVFDTSIHNWQTVIDFLRSSSYEISYTFNSDELELPSRVEDIFESWNISRNISSVCLSVSVASVILNCHFFSQEQIEFDIDPREIKSELHAKAVFEFMRQVGQLLDKEVILTHENEEDNPIFKVVPKAEQIQYFPHGPYKSHLTDCASFGVGALAPLHPLINGANVPAPNAS
jgi:hypothetical protein